MIVMFRGEEERDNREKTKDTIVLKICGAGGSFIKRQERGSRPRR